MRSTSNLKGSTTSWRTGEAWMLEQVGDVRLAACEEVVEADDLVAVGDEAVAEVRAEETGPTGDQDTHGVQRGVRRGICHEIGPAGLLRSASGSAPRAERDARPTASTIVPRGCRINSVETRAAWLTHVARSDPESEPEQTTN